MTRDKRPAVLSLNADGPGCRGRSVPGVCWEIHAEMLSDRRWIVCLCLIIDFTCRLPLCHLNDRELTPLCAMADPVAAVSQARYCFASPVSVSLLCCLLAV